MNEFRFDYRKYKNKSIDHKMLDDLMGLVLSSGVGYIQSIIAGVKLAVFLIYILARKKLIDDIFLIEKQEYEQGRVNTNASDIGNDELD